MVKNGAINMEDEVIIDPEFDIEPSFAFNNIALTTNSPLKLMTFYRVEP